MAWVLASILPQASLPGRAWDLLDPVHSMSKMAGSGIASQDPSCLKHFCE